MTLPTNTPAYLPFATGRYEVKPGLSRFGKSLGGGDADRHVFQFDPSFPRYRDVKLAARAERPGKYFCADRLSLAVEHRAVQFIVDRLTTEHPDLFTWHENSLDCSLTGERLMFDGTLCLRGAEDAKVARPAYNSAIDALAVQVQEDIAIVSVEDGHDWLSALHLSFPNFWAAEEKIGKPFPVVHQLVAGMDQMNHQSDDLVRVMLNARDGLVRFAWGVTWDDVLNHHPNPPADGLDRPAAFDPLHPRAFVRVERQTIWGFPDVRAALFTIRTYLYDAAEIRKDSGVRDSLCSAIESMSESPLAYKRLDASQAAFVSWLRADE